MSRYRELGQLAEGGMALVVQAERDDGVPVVVKRVRSPFCFDPSYLRMFVDEGRVHQALAHDNIVQMLEQGEDERGPFLVFEYVEGTDLGVVLAAPREDADQDTGHSSGALEVECVLGIALPLCAALVATHEACDATGAPLHVVHRDISPGNILLGVHGDVKLADFGVAASVLKTEVTVAGEMKGKFAYMAPEQTRGAPVDARTDLFAAGIVLWECLAGRRLFDGATDADVVAAVRTFAAPSLDELRPSLPKSLVHLVARMLEKDPAARPPSARDVAAELNGIVMELGLDEGLRRHVARLARSAPRQRKHDADEHRRRHTQRVLGPGAQAPVIVPVRTSSPWLRMGMAAVVCVLVVGAGLMRWSERTPVASASAAPSAPNAPLAVSVPIPTAVRLAAEAVTAAPAAGVTSLPPTSMAPATEPARGSKLTIGPSPAAQATSSLPMSSGPRALPRSRPPRQDAGLPLEKAKTVQLGTLTVTSEPWASVVVDGAAVARETPLRAWPLPAGRHTVVLENPLYGRRTIEVEVVAGAEVRRFVDFTQ